VKTSPSPVLFYLVVSSKDHIRDPKSCVTIVLYISVIRVLIGAEMNPNALSIAERTTAIAKGAIGLWVFSIEV